MKDARPKAGSPVATAEAEALRILLVDDNPSILRLLSEACRADGCVPATASTAAQALGLLADNQFDLIVTDIKMPGLSGFDLLDSVKNKQSGASVVLITGAPSVDEAAFALRHGAYDYLAKPFSVAEVRKLLARFRDDRWLLPRRDARAP